MEKGFLLIVEDQDDCRELLQLFLQQGGFDVMVAEDGRKAIALLEQFQPDAIITDIMMPNVSGIEFIEYVRSRPELRHIPITALTAARNELVKEAAAAGATKIMNKPVDFNELEQIITKLLSVSRPGE